MKLKNCNYKQFLNEIENKKVICFGAGKMLTEMEADFRNHFGQLNIVAITDNDSKKWHEIVTVSDKKVEILPPSNVFNHIDESYILLITSGLYMEIIEQLNQYVDDKTECYIFPFLRAIEQDKKSLSVSKSNYFYNKKNEHKIPKVIHYCWFGGKPIPDKHQKYIDTWKQFCPDYEIIRWDETNCNIRDNKYAYLAYENKKYGFVPDYFRLKIIYENGGIYLDVDVELVKNLDGLLYDEAYSGFETIENVNFGSGFGAVSGFPLLKEMMDYYEEIDFYDEKGNINLTASPIYQTRILERHGLKKNGSIQYVNGMKIYPFEYLCSQSLNTGIIYKTDNTHSIHRFAASWQDPVHVNNRNEKIKLLRKMSGYNY